MQVVNNADVLTIYLIVLERNHAATYYYIGEKDLGWMKFYQSIFPQFDAGHIDWMDTKNFDVVVLLTDDDFAFEPDSKYGWSNVIVIDHTMGEYHTVVSHLVLSSLVCAIENYH